MGKGSALINLTTEGLVKRAQHTSDKRKGPAYRFDFIQVDRILRPNCLDAYWLPMMVSLPNICESVGRIVRGFIV
jgi:hypothetical protein